MSKAAKIIGLVAVIVLVCGIAAAVALLNYDDPNDNSPGLIVDGNRVRNPGPILTMGAENIDFEEYRFYFLQMRSYFSQGDDSYWEDDPDGFKFSQLKSATEESIRYIHVWLTLATENGIGLSESELANINAMVEQTRIEQAETYPQWLADNHFLDEAQFRAITEQQAIATKMQNEYMNMLALQYGDELLENAVTAEHILISFEGQQREGDDADEAEQLAQERAEALADTIYGDIEASDDPIATFEELRGIYDDDYENQPVGGYTFVEGMMVEPFFEGALALETDEISQPIQTDYGYHILLRRALDTEAMEQNRNEMLAVPLQAMMNENIDEMMDALEARGGSYYDDITLDSIR